MTAGGDLSDFSPQGWHEECSAKENEKNNQFSCMGAR